MRYEDYGLQSEIYYKKILSFFGDNFSEKAQLQLNKTKSFVNPETQVFEWRLKMKNFRKVQEIQEKCQRVLDLYGYRLYSHQEEYLQIDPIHPKSDLFL